LKKKKSGSIKKKKNEEEKIQKEFSKKVSEKPIFKTEVNE